jgi:hypothetical protein
MDAGIGFFLLVGVFVVIIVVADRASKNKTTSAIAVFLTPEEAIDEVILFRVVDGIMKAWRRYSIHG